MIFPNRLKRHFFIFNMILPNEQSVNDIYGKIQKLSSNYLKKELKNQVIFNADRDGIIDAKKKNGIKWEVFLLCLWNNEVTRLFSDKLRDIEDKKNSKIFLILF